MSNYIKTYGKTDTLPKFGEESFLNSVQELKENSLFGVPSDVREVLARAENATKLIILGTNYFGAHLMHVKHERNCEVIAVVDDFRYNSGELYYGLPIISTDRFIELAKKDPDFIALNTCRRDSTKRFFDQVCRTHNIPHLNFEQAVRALNLQGKVDYRVDDWGSQIALNAPAYQTLAQKLEDDYSVQTLYAVLNFHLTCEPAFYHEIERPYSTLYFRSGLLKFSDTEKMVDCGASIGESLAGLVDITKGKFERVWMIEPDRINLQTLKNVLRRYEKTDMAEKITIHNCGVGELSTRVPFKHEGGHGGHVKPSDESHEAADLIDIDPIDSIIDGAPTFIKMDIEGSELSALKGAQQTIAKYKPKMAISAYHRATDLLDLTNFILAIHPDYKIGLRHHTSDRWDTCLYFY